MADTKRFSEATFGGGCFWCTDAIFRDLRGVEGVKPGYAGGHTENPTYEEVCTGTTGYAEVTRITFDPAVISYRDLLGVFFATHDPTTLNRQGHDIGPQYRSVVFGHDEEQLKEARDFIAEIERQKVFPAPIVTAVELLTSYHEAEENHHDYFRLNPRQPYCSTVVAPKVAQFRQAFADRLRS
jgi:peptide-methionine (S)-S-oxide reductase